MVQHAAFPQQLLQGHQALPDSTLRGACLARVGQPPLLLSLTCSWAVVHRHGAHRRPGDVRSYCLYRLGLMLPVHRGSAVHVRCH